MQRLVYSPSVKVWVKADSGVVDLSPYIVDCKVYRVINDVSTAEIEFRNPKTLQDGKPRFLFTERVEGDKVLPVFHPMDPIVITMERIAGRPIQVFTGYCDTVPDVQLFPGTATIKASCTLKRLLHTYWDPGLPFVQDFMFAYGWNLDKLTGQVGTTEIGQTIISDKNPLNDSSIGQLLYAVLNEIGGWDNDNIYIQPLPKNIGTITSKIFDQLAEENDETNQEIAKFIKQIVGAGSFGNASIGGQTPTSNAARPSSGGTGWKTTRASWFDDVGIGASGHLGNAPGGGLNYAELGTSTGPNSVTGTGYMAQLFGLSGELPFDTKVEIRYNGKSIIAYKTDRGFGHAGDGNSRSIDLWIDAANALGPEFKAAGRALVEIRLVD